MEYSKLTVSQLFEKIVEKIKELNSGLYQVMKLRDELRKFGLPIYGRKADLVNRLQERSKFLQSNGITKELVIVLNRLDLSKQTMS